MRRLLWDVMKNDATLFMRADQVEAAWRLLMPVLEVWAVAPPSDFPNYAAGTWGPEDTQGLLAQGHSWPLPTELVRQRKKKGGVRDFVSTQLRKPNMRQKFVVGNWKMHTTASVRCSRRHRLRRSPYSMAAASSQRTPLRCLAGTA